MSKKKEKTLLLPVFTAKTKNNLKKNPVFKKECAAYTKIARPYDYEDRIDAQLNSWGIIEPFIGDIIIDSRFNKDTRVKSVVIDDFFENWIKEKKIEPSIKAVNEYMAQITDDEATKLLKKNHLNMNLSLCSLPFVIMGDTSIEDKHYKLTQECAKEIQDIIEDVYGAGNVWIPGIVTTIDDLDCKKTDVLNKACRYFAGKDDIVFNDKYSTQTNKNKTRFFTLCIPIVIKNEFESCVYTIDELYNEKGIKEMKNITYSVNKVRFLSEYESKSKQNKTINVDNMTFEEYVFSLDTNVEFSMTESGLRTILADAFPLSDDQTIMFFRGWGEYKSIKEIVQEMEEDYENDDTKYFVFDSQTSYIDQFEKYFSNHRTASDILCFLDALGSKITDLCEGNLDIVPDEEKENIVIFIDYINERFYETIYRTMMDKYGDQLEIFGIAEYFRFEMTAMQMKEDLSNIDEDLVQEAQKIVRKIWIPEQEQTFTFAIVQGQESHEDCLYKSKVTLCEKADETLYIALVHYCAAMMMCGGGLSVRTYREDKKEEVFGIKGGNWDWDVCSEEEIRWAYTRLPDGSFLEPDKNTVFTEITKD